MIIPCVKLINKESPSVRIVNIKTKIDKSIKRIDTHLSLPQTPHNSDFQQGAQDVGGWRQVKPVAGYVSVQHVHSQDLLPWTSVPDGKPFPHVSF